MTLKQLVEKLKLKYPEWDDYHDTNSIETDDMIAFHEVLDKKKVYIHAYEDGAALGEFIVGCYKPDWVPDCPEEVSVYKDGLYVYVGNV